MRTKLHSRTYSTLFIFSSFTFHTDTERIPSLWKSNWWCRCAMFGGSITQQHSLTISVSSLISFSAFTFRTDTRRTPPLWKSNWRSRCTILGWNITQQHSQTKYYSLYLRYFYPSPPIQTLKELFLSQNHIGDTGAQYLSEALLTNRVRRYHSFYIYFIFLLHFLYRRSLNSFSLKIKSEMQVHNTWLKL